MRPRPCYPRLDWTYDQGELSSFPTVLISEDEYNSLRETLYLMRSPANAARLAQGIAQLEAGESVEVSMDDLAKDIE